MYIKNQIFGKTQMAYSFAPVYNRNYMAFVKSIIPPKAPFEKNTRFPNIPKILYNLIWYKLNKDNCKFVYLYDSQLSSCLYLSCVLSSSILQEPPPYVPSTPNQLHKFFSFLFIMREPTMIYRSCTFLHLYHKKIIIFGVSRHINQ